MGHTTAKRVSKCGRLLGLQPNSSSVAKRWEGAAPQLSLRPLPPLLHPHHFQHPRPLRRRLHHRGQLLRDPPALQYLLDLWIPSTAQLMSGTLGPPIRRTGAAESTTAAGSHSQEGLVL